jgi:transcriptional regulator with XRE-family HTH domain
LTDIKGGDHPVYESSIDQLGGVVKSSRLAKNMTQLQLAERLAITPRYLKVIENSGRKPSYDLLVRIIRELDIPADTVFYPESAEGKISAKIFYIRDTK